ncbi:histidine kinase-, DNA gyrase B-, and HSP90-like ATPase family protein [Clostridium baratii str. Sullivan]|uniref:histidine kinase n=1 Tax=Clostridium baratii str. Sullivan TaxID=1415775 RepID=A0A0A7FUI8_9CLOT|nr:sensor histidine kinase [Clostridium baratii]AIY82610.1 histidine kinase-, DNA gyrase B-, and HSP90-like ATPase family protein [Clostridium baratii str. Sullivan]
MKLFIKDNIGYISIYFISTFLTLGYLSLIGSVKAQECLYILFVNTFILVCFLGYRYYKNKEVYKLFEEGINELDEAFIDLGNSPLGENISNILNKQHSLCEAEIIKCNNIHEEHLTFINQWVHQMKTPLSTIKLLTQEYEGEEPVESMKAEVDKLNKGLNMAMYFARLDSFRKDFIVEKVSLHNLVLSKVNEEKQMFIKSRIVPRIEIDKSIEVNSDAKWMKFILEQLIVNALKYSKDYGKELIIKAYEDKNNIKLSVCDKGIGIPKKDIKRVFDPFFTGENGRKFGESTGMGLYIVKKVCDYLGHNISIDSKVLEGTSVTIIFNK